ncbi:uncharacterized protein I303_100829 [Kwoniella dejecticola CBS 10117]|uniref:BTB domain-containing protein n=1 Tax=Kwoniella dejecticola CBS 10117 TaxID=1296121 RepID=A0A1A6AG13_9TREE|nr:uncharacterized protein I303_00831 [Kwoniella dejecticola CBS 10117]OBR89010.1 hypothetical protein I303_00831 [Kwoniella dejecticola CBS 10117]
MAAKSSEIMVRVRYSDTSKDSIIGSSDEVPIYFYVDRYMIRSASELLSDTLNIKNHFGATHIPFKADAITCFLNQLYDPNPPPLERWRVVKEALELCQTYQAGIIGELIRSSLRPVIDQAPWEIFCLASIFNDVRLARKATKLMGRNGYTSGIPLALETIYLEDAAQPTLAYLLGLLKAIEMDRSQIIARYSQWNNVAKQFSPLT